MLRHPVAQETGRHADAHPALVHAVEGHRLEPGAISGVAEFLAQPAAHPRPLGLQIALASRGFVHARAWAEGPNAHRERIVNIEALRTPGTGPGMGAVWSFRVAWPKTGAARLFL